MARNNEANVILKYDIDNAGVNRVRASFQTMEYELEDMRANLTGVGSDAQRGVNALRQAFDRGEASVTGMQNEVEQLRAELLQLDNVSVSPTVTLQSTGGAITGGLNTVNQLGTIGSQIGGGLGGVGGQVGNIVNLFGDIAGAASTMNPALIAGAAAIGGVSLALGELKRYSDEAAEATRLELEGRQAAEAQADLSSLEKIDRINAIIDEVAAAEANIAARQATIDQRRQEAAAQFGLSVNNVIVLGLEPLEESINNSKGAITRLTAEFLELNASFDIRAARAFYDGITNVQHAAEMVSPVLNNIVGGFNDLADKARSLPDELRAAGEAEAARKAQAAAEASALQVTLSSALFDSVNATVKAQESSITAQNAYNAALEASQQRIAELNDKLQADLASAADERDKALIDAERDAAEQRIKITEDSEKERARIQQRFARSYTQAVADRDAVAAARAEQQREDELEDVDQRYKDQLKTVDDNLARQQRIIEQRYNQQVQTARAAADAAIRLEQQRAQAELALKAQAVQAAQVALINAQNTERLIRTNYQNQSITDATAWANQLRFLTAYAFTLPKGAAGGIGGGSAVAQRAAGGPVNAGMPYLIGERGPELFVPRVSGTIMPNRGGSVFTVNFEGATGGTIRATSKAQAIAVLDRVLTSMGAA